MSNSRIIRGTLNYLKNAVSTEIETILIAKNKTANLIENASFVPVLDCPNEDETCTIDRVYLKWDANHKECHAMVDFSNSYMNDWDFVSNLPIEVALDILDCLEEDVWEDDEDNE